MHINLDTDNREKLEKYAQELGVSVASLVNTLIRNIKTIEQQTTVEMKDAEVRTPKAIVRLTRRTSWITKY